MAVRRQTGAFTTEPFTEDGNGPFALFCMVDEDSLSIVSRLSLKIPGGTTLTGARDLDDGWRCIKSYSTLSALQSGAKTGTYSVSIRLKSGSTETEKLSLTSSMVLPSTIPLVSNYATLREVDVASNPVATWQAFRCNPSADVGMVSLSIMANDGTILESVEGSPISPGATSSFTSYNLANLSEFNAGRRLVLLLQFADAFATKECSNFDGAVKAIMHTNVTLVPIVSYKSLSTSDAVRYTTSRGKTWVLDSIDGTLSALGLVTTKEFDYLYIYVPTSHEPIHTKVELRPNSIDAAPLIPDSVRYDSRDGETEVRFDNPTPRSGVTSAYLCYDAEGFGGIYRISPFDMSQFSRDWEFVPTLNLKDGIVQSVDMRKIASDGSELDLSDMEIGVSFMCRIGTMGQGIITEPVARPQTVRHITFEQIDPIDITNVATIRITGKSNNYQEALVYDTITLEVTDNPFSNAQREYGWGRPSGEECDSFLGWFNDDNYPYVYSASADKLNNGGTYLGDGDGWLYFSHAPNSDPGHYIYRYATGTWCYSRRDWNGWVYDYASGWLDLTPERE
jgi:hypothetical protein